MTLRHVSRMVPLALAAAGVFALAPAVSAAGSGVDFTPGAAGFGDSYFPLDGNGGYDALHYDLDISYVPDTDRLDGTVQMRARATQNLSRFDLDLKDLTVSSVTVNAQPADFHQDGQEIVITPPHGLHENSVFVTSVTYGGIPQTIVGSPIVFGSPYGFLHTPDGAFIGTEPNASATWRPLNDHPGDKASYTTKVTVPKGLKAISNGQLLSETTHGDKSTFLWNETSPMANYLSTIDIGNWVTSETRTPGGIKNFVAVDPVLLTNQPNAVEFFRDTTAQVTDLWSQKIGTFPFDSTGAIADDARYQNVPLGFSLETQTRPVYSAVRSTSTIAHELAHQWYGDAVTVERWKDIWLNESFATWWQWYWDEVNNVRTTAARARLEYNRRPFPDPVGRPYWSIQITDPQRDTMFNQRVYTGGGMVLQFLKEKIGDDKFFELMRTWYSQHKDGNANSEQFVALASQVSGQDLTDFFNTWIYSTGKPPLPS